MIDKLAYNQPYTYKAIVTAVYDGDSFTCDIDLGFNSWIMNQKMRLLYLDTPEIRGDERSDGIKVRDIVRDMILNKEVIIHTKKDEKGKYGRWLCEVTIGELNLNTWLLENKYAKPY